MKRCLVIHIQERKFFFFLIEPFMHSRAVGTLQTRVWTLRSRDGEVWGPLKSLFCHFKNKLEIY